MSGGAPQADRQGVRPPAPHGLVLGRATARIGEVPYAVTIDVGRHVIVADEPATLGGQDTGPTPFGILLAALGACTSATLKMYAEHKGWRLRSLEVGLRYLRPPAGGADRIERTLDIEGLDDRQCARLADVAERTPVTLVIKRGVEIETRLVGGAA